MPLNEIINKISRGTSEIINLKGLKEKLTISQKKGKPLIIKAGFDPTAPDIHLGHVVLLRKLKQLQDLGHEINFLIGDFTAQIGDPTGKTQLRPQLSSQEILKNADTYKDQVFKILDAKKTKVVFNSQWLGKMLPDELIRLTMHSSVAQMLARADFKKRFEEKKEISILEFIYPLLQGYDSVYLKADIELGGTDQKFNLLMGRQLQEKFDQDPQIVIMTPLLEGVDGIQKMSKSLGNYIGINEPPKEIFGKIMSISDPLMMKYFEILTEEDLEKIKTLHPKEAKIKLAQVIVTQFYDEPTAKLETELFEKIFAQGKMPEDIKEYRLTVQGESLIDILLEAEMIKSKNEFRRLVKQGSISFQEEKIKDENWKPKTGILKIGKRRFLKLVD